MSETMIERLANVLRSVEAPPPPLPPRITTAEIQHFNQVYAEACVRAVLQALREPSEGMQVAGAREHVEVAHTFEGEGRCLTPSLVWRAMLDHILSEDQPAQPPREREEA